MPLSTDTPAPVSATTRLELRNISAASSVAGFMFVSKCSLTLKQLTIYMPGEFFGGLARFGLRRLASAFYQEACLRPCSIPRVSRSAALDGGKPPTKKLRQASAVQRSLRLHRNVSRTGALIFIGTRLP